MTSRHLTSVVLVVTLVALAPSSARAAVCLTAPRPWYDGHIGAVSATPDGQRIAKSAADSALKAPAVRVTPESAVRPAFITRLDANRWSLESDLEVGRYRAELLVVTFRWPDEGTTVDALVDCEPLLFDVTRSTVPVWAPNPQVFGETLGRQVAAGVEWYAVRWGVGLVGGYTLDPASAATWHLRGEVRRSATRGYLAFGMRADRELAQWPVGLTGSFGIELPPFGRRPVWLVGEVHTRRWTGDWEGWGRVRSYVSAFDPLRTISLGVRIDGRRVRR